MKMLEVGVGAIKLKSVVLSIPLSNVLVMILEPTVDGKLLVWSTTVGDIFGAETDGDFPSKLKSPTLDGRVNVSPEEDVSMTTPVTIPRPESATLSALLDSANDDETAEVSVLLDVSDNASVDSGDEMGELPRWTLPATEVSEVVTRPSVDTTTRGEAGDDVSGDVGAEVGAEVGDEVEGEVAYKVEAGRLLVSNDVTRVDSDDRSVSSVDPEEDS